MKLLVILSFPIFVLSGKVVWAQASDGHSAITDLPLTTLKGARQTRDVASDGTERLAMNDLDPINKRCRDSLEGLGVEIAWSYSYCTDYNQRNDQDGIKLNQKLECIRGVDGVFASKLGAWDNKINDKIAPDCFLLPEKSSDIPKQVASHFDSAFHNIKLTELVQWYMDRKRGFNQGDFEDFIYKMSGPYYGMSSDSQDAWLKSVNACALELTSGLGTKAVEALHQCVDRSQLGQEDDPGYTYFQDARSYSRCEIKAHSMHLIPRETLYYDRNECEAAIQDKDPLKKQCLQDFNRLQANHQTEVSFVEGQGACESYKDKAIQIIRESEDCEKAYLKAGLYEGSLQVREKDGVNPKALACGILGSPVISQYLNQKWNADKMLGQIEADVKCMKNLDSVQTKKYNSELKRYFEVTFYNNDLDADSQPLVYLPPYYPGTCSTWVKKNRGAIGSTVPRATQLSGLAR